MGAASILSPARTEPPGRVARGSVTSSPAVTGRTKVGGGDGHALPILRDRDCDRGAFVRRLFVRGGFRPLLGGIQCLFTAVYVLASALSFSRRPPAICRGDSSLLPLDNLNLVADHPFDHPTSPTTTGTRLSTLGAASSQDRIHFRRSNLVPHPRPARIQFLGPVRLSLSRVAASWLPFPDQGFSYCNFQRSLGRRPGEEPT